MHWKYSLPKSALLFRPLQTVILNEMIGWRNICCGRVCLLMLVFGLRNVMTIPSLFLIFIYSVGDCWFLRISWMPRRSRFISTPHQARRFLPAEVSSSSKNKGTVRSPQRRSPSCSQYSFPKGSESPFWREGSSPQSILYQCLLTFQFYQPVTE